MENWGITYKDGMKATGGGVFELQEQICDGAGPGDAGPGDAGGEIEADEHENEHVIADGSVAPAAGSGDGSNGSKIDDGSEHDGDDQKFFWTEDDENWDDVLERLDIDDSQTESMYFNWLKDEWRGAGALALGRRLV